MIRRQHRYGPWRGHLVAALASAGAIALVTGAVWALQPIAPVLSLGVLYLFAVLPIAAAWGIAYATAVSVVSMLSFNYLFLPPRHTFQLADSENWVALAVYLITAVSVSGLAARARRRAAEAEQQRREAAFAAEISTLLLEHPDVRWIQAEPGSTEMRDAGRSAGPSGRDADAPHGLEARAAWPRPGAHRAGAGPAGAGTRSGSSLAESDGRTARADRWIRAEIAARTADLLGVPHCWLELDPDQPLADDERSYALQAGGRELGRLLVDVASDPDPAVTSRVLALLSSLLATASERDRLARSDTAKTALLRSVSHDLRSPLTAISAATDLLAGAHETLCAAERDELVASIELQVRRLDRTVANLLDLSRLEAGAATPRLELWPVDSLLERALAALGADGDRVGIVLPAGSPAVQVDAAQIEHALVNLLENALRHSAPGDLVELAAEQHDGEVAVRVRDGGPGVDAGEREAIFEPFARGARTTGSGTGLGLAIARGFAELNGGRLWVEPSESAGATFCLVLPAVAVPAEVPA